MSCAPSATPDPQLARIIGAYRRGLAPPTVLPLDEWARQFLESPVFKGGRYDPSLTPYVIEIMRCLSIGSPVQNVVCVAGTQTFKTALGLAWLFYTIYYGDKEFMHVRPKLDSVRQFVRERIDPLWTLPCLVGKVAPPRSRSKANTTKFKEYDGGFLFCCGTHSADDLSAKTVKRTWQDEVDREDASAGREGPAHELLPKRATTYGATAQHLWTTSPTTIDGPGWQMYLNSSMAEFYVPCPHCGQRQTLSWSGIRLDGDARGPDAQFSVWYECAHCKARIDEWRKGAMLAAGVWVHAHPERIDKGYRLPSFYSPPGWRSWKAIARSYVRAADAYKAGDPGPMTVVRNTDFAEPFTPQGEDEVPVNVLLSRREAWLEKAIPAGVRVITCGVDVQEDRLECHIIGWGAKRERWTLDYVVLRPDDQLDEDGRSDWEKLDDLRRERYQTEDGRPLPITLTFIDLGYRTDDAYKYTRSRSPHEVVGVFGRDDSKGPRPVIERLPRKDQKRRNALYRIVGTDAGKTALFRALRTWDPKHPGGPGTWHFPLREWCDQEWFAQLLSEHSEYVKNRRNRKVTIWVQHRHRNEVLDTADYAYAAYLTLEIEGRLRRLIVDDEDPPAGRIRTPRSTSARASGTKDGTDHPDNRDVDEPDAAASRQAPGPVRASRGWHGGSDPRRD